MKRSFGFDLPAGAWSSPSALRIALVGAHQGGEVEAAYSLAVSFATGEWLSTEKADGPLNLEASAHWYRIAAEQGHAEAQFNLGLMLLLGEGKPVETEAGLAWLEASSENGYLYSAKVLGDLYEAGSHGLVQSHSEAVRWRSFARGGHSER